MAQSAILLIKMFNQVYLWQGLTVMLLLLLQSQQLFVEAASTTNKKQIIVGIDGSFPASPNSWRLGRTYDPLTVQHGVQVLFSSYSSHGLIMSTNFDDFWNCTGNGTTLLEPNTPQGQYLFDTAEYPVGNYYFYNNNLNMLMCKAAMRAELIVEETIGCGKAKAQKNCKLLAQCSWRKVNRKLKCAPKQQNTKNG